MFTRAGQSGFTLVELVMVIVLTGILAGVGALIITGPMGGYVDQERRAQLVDAAETALRRMSREIRVALPNSVRVGCAGNCIEFLLTTGSARYREGPGPGATQQEHRLRFNQTDDSFNTTGPTGQAFGSSPWFIAIYNTGQTGANAWERTNPGVMTLDPSITIGASGVAGEDRITLNTAFQFAHESPRQRLHFVEGPVAFRCEADGYLYRYANYGFDDSPPPINFNGESRSPLADYVESCQFEYALGTATRAGLVSLRIVLMDAGERVRLLHQVYVSNLP
jgi:MSHA biogenesis protein MshO